MADRGAGQEIWGPVWRAQRADVARPARGADRDDTPAGRGGQPQGPGVGRQPGPGKKCQRGEGHISLTHVTSSHTSVSMLQFTRLIGVTCLLQSDESRFDTWTTSH